MLTGELMRAARALSRLRQAELAALAGVSLETVKRFERVHGDISANARTVSAILLAFEKQGVRIDFDQQAVWLPRDAGALGD